MSVSPDTYEYESSDDAATSTTHPSPAGVLDSAFPAPRVNESADYGDPSPDDAAPHALGNALELAAANRMLPTPTDPELRSAAPLGPATSAAAATPAAARTPADLDAMVTDVARARAQLPRQADIMDIEVPAPSVATVCSLATTVEASEVASTVQIDDDDIDGPSAATFRHMVPSAPVLSSREAPPLIGTTPAHSRETVISSASALGPPLDGSS